MVLKRSYSYFVLVMPVCDLYSSNVQRASHDEVLEVGQACLAVIQG